MVHKFSKNFVKSFLIEVLICINLQILVNGIVSYVSRRFADRLNRFVLYHLYNLKIGIFC